MSIGWRRRSSWVVARMCWCLKARFRLPPDFPFLTFLVAPNACRFVGHDLEVNHREVNK